MKKQYGCKPLGRWVAAAFLFLGAAGAWAQAPAAPPVAAFFQNPAMGAGKMSPNGRHLALTVAPKDGRTQLLVIDVEKQGAKLVAGYADADIGRFEWVNDDRLVYTVRDNLTGQGDEIYGPGLFAVDRDGSNFRQLVHRQSTFVTEIGDRKLLPPHVHLLATTREQASDDVFIGYPDYNIYRSWDAVNILRLNTRTGRTTAYSRPGNSVAWVIDAHDVPRVSTSYEKGRVAVHYLDPAGDKWRLLAEWDAVRETGIRPVALAPDGTLFVAARKAGDLEALYRYDTAKNALNEQPIVALKDFDFRGDLIMNGKGVLGVRYVSDAEGTVWFDPQVREWQAKVDARLPGTVNRLSLPLRPELPFIAVHAYSDRDPGNVMLYNTATGKFTPLGETMRGIDPRRMANRDFLRYKARDGLEVPAWLTLPSGSKGRKLPLVVLVHGGPWVPGSQWRWEADSQFLASRGYAVLEPQFRGTLGYGFRHYRASWKQWGRSMQDDVADGARWAIAQGIVDPARICIAGASYGGYATLMGLLNDPDLYKCGIDWVGVTDVALMYSVVWSDFDLDSKVYSMPLLIGDPDKDKEQLTATSPLAQAARIRKPLLLAYGGADRRVPIVHGTRFKQAVEKTNPDVEWVEYLEEGHGWFLVKNRIDFWSRVEKFLERNIGGAK